MQRRKNPFPGVCRHVDRHGKTRWRYRSKGFSCYIHGAYGSAQFIAEYEAAKERTKTPAVTEHFERGSLAWLIESYLRSVGHKNKSDATRRVLKHELDWLREQAGKLPFARFEARHVEALMGRKDGPAAANRVRKNLSMLFKFAQKYHELTHNPVRLADKRIEAGDRWHTWTKAEMSQFVAHHGPGTKARLVFALAANTGAARQDIAAMTWENIQGDKIEYKRGKTGVRTKAPIKRLLSEELARLDRESRILVSHGQGSPYKPETLGNWFKDQCVAAGLPHCSLHGIRKGMATALADAGATEHELMAYLAHGTPKEAATYTKEVNRDSLTGKALARADGPEEENLSNLLNRLGKPEQ